MHEASVVLPLVTRLQSVLKSTSSLALRAGIATLLDEDELIQEEEDDDEGRVVRLEEREDAPRVDLRTDETDAALPLFRVL